MRDTYLDTSKGILIFLVVFGHFLERIIGWDNETNRILLSTIYFVHMPAFIFISGVFFKHKDIFQKVVYFLSLLIPFQIAYVLFDSIINHQISFAWLIKPYWILWYLVGMVVWTILTPLLKKIGYPVLISIVLSMLIGLSPIDNYLFSVGRVFVFLPFFVIGSVYGKQIIEVLKTNRVYAFLGFLFLIFIVFIVKFSDIESSWLFGSLSYKQSDVGMFEGLLTRLLVFVISSLGVLSILAITQIFKTKFVSLGQHTLPIYLLHGFIVIVLSHFFKYQDSFALGLMMSVFLSVNTCLILRFDVFEKSIKSMSSLLMKSIKL
ncbi:acyltransferase family protein [Acinetobacter silvestris]|uniref:Acyltransferase 3 domain-containing protein n=1 Tax=Acinetobacter silvestris TaxID=1977882 RepID=A0A1Y3CDA1_9GAMM|nr:acyltransferase family protein [Acinetobacter silvestris]OTG65049.1 hypothetical protein B9T28_09640 [Acinetobacter silvestris]